jgi:hypothetical protein
MPRLRASDVGDRRDGDARHPHAAAAVVLGRLPDGHPHPGISAVQLKRQLGIGRYDTTWLLLHKLRGGMVAPEREALTGPVEADDLYVGGVEEGRGGGRKCDFTKAIAVAAIGCAARARGARASPWSLNFPPRRCAASSARSLTRTRWCTPTAGRATGTWVCWAMTTAEQANASPRPANGNCRACTARSPTSRPGCPAPTAAFHANICRSISTSWSFATTAGARRWPPSRPCSDSAPSARPPPTPDHPTRRLTALTERTGYARRPLSQAIRSDRRLLNRRHRTPRHGRGGTAVRITRRGGGGPAGCANARRACGRRG